MRSIPADEIKRRGISAVDEAMKEGPVYIVEDGRPAYVIMGPSYYEDLADAAHEAFMARVKESLADMKAGRVRRTTAQELIEEFGLEREVDDADGSHR